MHLSGHGLSGRQRRVIAHRMVHLAQTDPDDTVREEAVHGLRWVRAIDPVEVFVAASADPAPMVRGQAIAGLGGRAAGRWSSSFQQRVLAVIERGLADPHADVRFWALFAVGQLGLIELRAQVLALVDDAAPGACGKRTVGEEARAVGASLPTP